jgi:hypothetical protein
MMDVPVTIRWPERAHAQDVVEYGLLLATVAVLVLLAAMTFGGMIHEWYVRLFAHVVSGGG